jgi:hypothetical protein
MLVLAQQTLFHAIFTAHHHNTAARHAPNMDGACFHGIVISDLRSQGLVPSFNLKPQIPLPAAALPSFRALRYNQDQRYGESAADAGNR